MMFWKHEKTPLLIRLVAAQYVTVTTRIRLLLLHQMPFADVASATDAPLHMNWNRDREA